jgi:lipopolysaccharide transport system ATP-binding protein
MGEVSKGEGKTVLFVSHNLSSIKSLCKEGIVLCKGELSNYSKVDLAIGYYLMQSKEFINKSFVYYNNQLNSSGFTLVSAFLHNSDLIKKSSFEVSEDVFIVLEVLCKKIIPGVYAYITIVDDNQNLIVECDSQEFGKNILDNLQIGLNRFSVRIPRLILAVGNKNIYINFTSINADNWNVESPGNILSFEILDNTTTRGVKRNALTSLILEWSKI